MSRTVYVYIPFMGEDFIAEVDYTMTYAGHPGTPPSLSYPGDPPEGPEWDTESIVLYADLPEGPGPAWVIEPDTAQFTHIANHQRITDDICDEINSRSDDIYFDDDWDD